MSSIAVRLVCLSLAVCGLGDSARAGVLAITGATIIDGTGADPVRNGSIVISDGRIAAVGSADTVSIPRNARKIDGRGKYVIPGLMDGVNLTWFILNVESLVRFEGRYHEIMVEAAQVALKNGLTGVFATWRSHGPAMQARDMIGSGQVPGSTIYVGGNIIGFDGLFSPDSYAEAAPYVSKEFVAQTNEEWEQGTGRRLMWMTSEEVRAVIHDYLQKHKLDYVKYAASGHFSQGGYLSGQFISFSPRAQKAIVEEGHSAGLSVQAHTMSVESIDMAIEAGVDILTHGDMSGPREIPEETLRKLVERNVSAGVLPITQRRMEALDATVGGDTTKLPGVSQFQHVSKANRRNMIKAGVKLMLGTETMIMSPEEAAESRKGVSGIDPSFQAILGEGHINAMVALEEEGLSRMEILKAATSNIAQAYKLIDRVGTLEAGKVADIVVLTADPLADVHNYRNIAAVIKEGKIIDREKLPSNPLITAPKS